jgi:UDP-2-acetamido-3-amino-2,3-dideoxy-glucuronate N-acetyltransferase
MTHVHATATVHASAIVDDGAHIGAGTSVWHFTHVCAGAHVGERCSLGQGVFVANSVRIGHGVRVQNNVSLYDGVTLDNDVFCGPSVVFTNVRNPRAAVPRKHEYRPTHVKRGATLGANATVVCGVTIGEHAFVAAGAVVAGDVPPFALVMGVPARHVGWMSRHGSRLDLPMHGDAEAHCPSSGERYALRQGHVICLDDARDTRAASRGRAKGNAA